jgi:hypothetical protein
LHTGTIGAGQCVEPPVLCEVPHERVLIESEVDACIVDAGAIGEVLIGAVSVAVEG